MLQNSKDWKFYVECIFTTIKIKVKKKFDDLKKLFTRNILSVLDLAFSLGEAHLTHLGLSPLKHC